MSASAAGTEEFEALRPRLFGIAYRMTGSVGDAEDACQDAWLRWQGVDHADVDNAEAYLVRTVTRLAIDRLRSAHHRKETYVGPYLPEPLVVDDATETQPEVAAELADSLTLAFLVLLDELSPVERAVLLLHDVFGYPFDEVAEMVDSSPAACRQLASRTRRKLHENELDLRRPRAQAEQELVGALLATVASGDVERVMALLAPDIVLLSDGGAAQHAARRPVVGPDRVARFMVNLAHRLRTDTDVRFVQVNGEAGAVFRVDERPGLVLSFSFAPDGRVRRIFGQLNPEKLRHLT
jgi:RNA polymerase sigma-70 factor (ECF subfamily)